MCLYPSLPTALELISPVLLSSFKFTSTSTFYLSYKHAPQPSLSLLYVSFLTIVSFVVILICIVYSYFYCIPHDYLSSLRTGIMFALFIIVSTEINEEQPDKNKQNLFIKSLQGSQPPSLEFWQSLKGRQNTGKNRRLQVCPDWRLLAWGCCRHAN